MLEAKTTSLEKAGEETSEMRLITLTSVALRNELFFTYMKKLRIVHTMRRQGIASIS